MTVGVHAAAPTGGNSGISITTPSRTSQASGSTFILIGACFGDTFGGTPVQDSKSNTWTQVGTSLSLPTATGEIRVYKAVNATGGAGHTFTLNPGAAAFPALFMVEVPDALASPIITFDRQLDTSTPYTSPSISPATATTLIGGLFSDAPSGTETDTWGGSFSSGDKIEALTDANSTVTGSMAANVQASAGTFSASVTVSGVTVTDAGVLIVAVQTSTGGGGASVQSTEAPNRPRPGRGPFSRGRFYVSDTTAYTTAVNSALSGSSALTFAQTGVLKGAGALTGSSALAFGQTGALAGAGALAGTSALVFGQTGTLTQPGLSGSAALTFGQSGTLSAAGILAGTSALQFGQTAALAATGVLAGTSALSFAQTGTVTAVGILAGTSALTFAQTATLAATGVLAGTSALTFGASATADAPPGALQGTAALSFGASGTLSGFGALIGACQIVISASGVVPNTNAQPGPVDSPRSAEGFYRRKKKRRQVERPAQPVVIAPASFEHEIPTAVIAQATSFQSLADLTGKPVQALRATVDQEIEALLRDEAERDDQEALQWILNALD